jgi:hypothetical protein
VRWAADLALDPDLASAREQLEASRERGVPFNVAFDDVVNAIARRPANSLRDRIDREQLVRALRDFAPAWRAAYTRRDPPKRAARQDRPE